MNREDENKQQQAPGQSQQPVTGKDLNPRQEDDDQDSYPGKLDHVEGRMNNGELGGGLRKEEE